MLQMHTTRTLEQTETELRKAAERHGGSVAAVTHAGELLRDPQGLKGRDALILTFAFPDLYAPLLEADVRFAAFLPGRIAICSKGDGVTVEAISPGDYCRLLHRPELEQLAEPLESVFRQVMEEAARGQPGEAPAAEHPATEDQINMRGAVPQRVDGHGTKVEELAGTGAIDSQGG